MSQLDSRSDSPRRIRGLRKLILGLSFCVSCVFPILLSSVGLFLALWIVIPAPIALLLPLAVGAPEVSPWLAGIHLIALLLSIKGLTQSWLLRVAFGSSVLGLILSLLPLLQVPIAHQTATTAFQTALGKDYTQQVPFPIQQQWRSRPFIWRDALRGIPTGEVRQTSNIPFANPAGVSLTLNLYRPPQVGRYPTIVIIYGGAWRRGTPSNDEAFSRYMAARGYTVVAIDYRHAPRFTFPAQLEDVNTALRFLRQQADAYEIDDSRIALMGRSAGAHLAMLAAYQPDAPPIRAVVNYYGPVELTLGYDDPPRPDPLDTPTLLRDFLGGTPAEVPDLYRQASPYHYATRKLPPTLLIYGGRDHVVQAKFGRALADRLQAFEPRSIFLEIPWAEHAFDAVFNGVSNQLALYHTERFLAWALQ